MAKESYYFSHDHNARNDQKLVRLQKEMGLEGIGLYWCVIEMLHEEGGYLLISEISNIAYALRIDESKVRHLVEGHDLFKKDVNRFWSKSALGRIKKRNEKSIKASKSAKKRSENPDTDAMRTHSEGNAIKERKGKEKEIKQKEIKEKEIIVNEINQSDELLSTTTTDLDLGIAEMQQSTTEINDQFERCYREYGKDGNKDDALVMWNQLNLVEKNEIEFKVQSYVDNENSFFRPQFFIWIDPNSARNFKDWNIPDRPDQFTRCFEAYGGYGDRDKAFRVWQNLSPDDRKAIESKIPLYVASTPGGDYRCAFENWLNRENKTNWTTPVRVKKQRSGAFMKY